MERFKMEGQPGTIEIDTAPRSIRLTYQQYCLACEIFNKYSDIHEVGPSRPEAKELAKYFIEEWFSQAKERVFWLRRDD